MRDAYSKKVHKGLLAYGTLWKTAGSGTVHVMAKSLSVHKTLLELVEYHQCIHSE